MEELVKFLRGRLAAELDDVEGYDGGWNDADGCWGIHVDPDFTRADVRAKQTLLDDLLAEPHVDVDDPFYSCAVVGRADTARFGGPCDCGRDDRVNRHLRLLAQPYADHPDYRTEWRL